MSGSRWGSGRHVSILALAAVLDFYGIDQNGFGSTYYATTVRSMSTRTWHNWFFASFDPGGLVTVDKPPLGFWIQAISVRLFGFHGVSLILPQAIAGVLSVGVLYCIVRQAFGRARRSLVLWRLRCRRSMWCRIVIKHSRVC